MRTTRLLIAALTCLLVPVSTSTAAQASVNRDPSHPRCLASAPKVAKTKLRAHGHNYGLAYITVSTKKQGDFSYVVCAYTKVAKKYRRHQNIVRQSFFEHADTGEKLGEVQFDAYADKTKPGQFGLSYTPHGYKFVFKTKIEADMSAKGTVTYRVPS